MTMHTFKIVRDVFGGLRPHDSVAGSQGLSRAVLVDGDDGSTHVELAVCQLEPGGWVNGHLHPFEESFFILDGSADVGIDGSGYALVPGDFGFVPVATPHAWRNTHDVPVRWYSIRSPQPRQIGRSRGTFPAPHYRLPQQLRPVREEDPTVRFVGHFDDADLGAPGSLSMPGYHGHQVRDIAVRMMVDDVLGAVHHTNFMIQFAPRRDDGLSGSSHFHDFEEAYLLLAGHGEVTLEGEVHQVQAGDLVWQSSSTMHGWVNRGTTPLRFIELQAPRPPSSNAVVFEGLWNEIAERSLPPVPSGTPGALPEGIDDRG
jgi:mannose-6-phosphate isomerase-like protein (cupin superfamily)